MNRLTSKAFTLVELLIVIGIIGLLAVTVLLALNPAEAQRKARDTDRILDAATLQAVLEQIVNEGNIVIPTTPADSLGGTNGIVSSISGSNANLTSQNCTVAAGHWLGGYDLCPYVKTVPLDPQNGRTATYQTGVPATPTATGIMLYRARVSGTDYEINVRQESSSNVAKLTGDGGDSPEWFEVFSGNNALLP